MTKFWIAARLPAYESTLYAPRVLSSDGSRLYFESADPLLARDTNGEIDVYQWERAGRGGCSAAEPTYSPAAKGCVDLISSGQSELDSRFIDASPSGSDVFFATLASLYPADPGLVDVYDARALGGFPAPPAPAPECEGEQCQSPPPAPEFETPATLNNVGPGNLAAPTFPFARCNKAARRAQRFSRRARALRRSARNSARLHNPRAMRRARALRGKATRYARAAHKQSAHAKRCRARVRKGSR